MGTHPSGDGVAWDSIEAIDADQPHGKDYVTFNHIAIAVRKRMMQEHSEFGDTTAGGIHKPGGCAVLGMEITDTAGDPTALVVADGTYRGHGLVWSYKTDSTDEGVIFCATAAAGASTTGDWTVMAIHPDRQWKGGDITWAGNHEFDGTVDFTTGVNIDGTIDIVNTLICGSDLGVAGDFSCDGTADFASAVAFASDVSIDATLAFQDAVLTGDSTLTFDAIAGETGPTVKMFGDWSSRTQDTTYTARTDGLVIAYNTTDTADLKLETPAGTLRQYDDVQGQSIRSSLTGPVRGGDTWALRADPTTSSATVWWLPFGDNT